MKRETVTLALNSLQDRHISETAVFSPGAVQDSPERIVNMRKKRIFTLALAAALILALGVTAYALAGLPRSVGTHAMSKNASYASLADLPKVQKDVGYPVAAPESFSNGYRFSELRVMGEAVFDENNEVLQDFYGVHVLYTRSGSPDLHLDLEPVLTLEGGSKAPEPTERRTVNGVTVDLSRDIYKVVPADYEKTEADLAREAAGHYYVSFGADTIREYEMAFAGFELDGVKYILLDMAASADSFDTLAEMAGEVIETAES